MLRDLTGKWPKLSRQEMNGRGGCQCKLPPLDLEDLLEAASASASISLADLYYPEDCAVVDAGAARLLLSTDLAPLTGIDLFAAGQIAALHSMSDIYASGGLPKWALVNLVVDLSRPKYHAEQVLAGIMQQCKTEGTQVVGGQTLSGPEAMAGLMVVGTPRKRVIRKHGAQAGDVLLLSKPLGVGLVLRAYKLGLLNEAALDTAVSVMLKSNSFASEAAVEADVHACTDITGFGFLIHLHQMLETGLGAVIQVSKIPVLSETACLPPNVARTVWIEGNYQYVSNRARLAALPALEEISVLLDPQTNGGLLVSARPERCESLCDAGFLEVGTITQSGCLELRP